MDRCGGDRWPPGRYVVLAATPAEAAATLTFICRDAAAQVRASVRSAGGSIAAQTHAARRAALTCGRTAPQADADAAAVTASQVANPQDPNIAESIQPALYDTVNPVFKAKIIELKLTGQSSSGGVCRGGPFDFLLLHGILHRLLFRFRASCFV